MKLELKHLSPYLPYGLKGVLQCDMREDFHECEWISDESIFEKGSIWTYAGYADKDLSIPLSEGDFSGFLIRNGNNYTSVGNSIKPILRTLSDLNKEIMLDLFKLVDESDYTDTLPLNFNDIEFQVDDEWNYVLQIGSALEFHTTGSTFGLFYQGEAFTIWNQLDLFNKMFEMHFDIFGLIEKGLAIDINTLK